MSLKSFPWVFENMDVPKNVQDDVRWLGEPLGSFIKKFHNRISGSTLKNMAYGGQFLGSRTPKINFCWIQKVSIPIYFIHGTIWCIKKNLTTPIMKMNIFLGHLDFEIKLSWVPTFFNFSLCSKLFVLEN